MPVRPNPLQLLHNVAEQGDRPLAVVVHLGIDAHEQGCAVLGGLLFVTIVVFNNSCALQLLVSNRFLHAHPPSPDELNHIVVN